MSNAEQLLQLLTSVELESHLDDPVKLGAAMAQRQALLIELQNADTTALDELARARVHNGLRALLASDEQLQKRLAERLEDRRKSMQKLAPGRAAVRGYGNHVQSTEVGFRRIG